MSVYFEVYGIYRSLGNRICQRSGAEYLADLESLAYEQQSTRPQQQVAVSQQSLHRVDANLGVSLCRLSCLYGLSTVPHSELRYHRSFDSLAEDLVMEIRGA